MISTMLLTDLIKFGGWTAAILLAMGYWLQVWRIHVHKEVRDISLPSYILFTIAYMLFGAEAYSINSTLFFWKNILVLVPTIVIIFQVVKHKDDSWKK